MRGADDRGQGAAAGGRSGGEAVYDAVALGMGAYARTAFRVEVIRDRGWRLRAGMLLVSTHRAETDVPLLGSTLYLAGRILLRRRPRMHFAARDDLFERGFFAGFPPGLGPRTRRALWPLGAGRVMPLLRAHPIGSATSISLARALAVLPGDAPLGPDLLPAAAREALSTRAAELGRAAPRTASDARRGEYADLLWRRHDRSELTAPAFEGLWRRRMAESAGQLRTLIELMREGEPLVLFPEGRPSPDGAIGPLRPGLGALVRRGRPRALQPIAIAYDHLCPGRARAWVAFGPPLAPPRDAVEAVVLSALRLAMPLTCGAAVAHHLVDAATAGRTAVAVGELEDALGAAARAAHREGRPVERALVRPGAAAGRRRLAESLTALARLGVLGPQGGPLAALDPERALACAPLLRAAREHASARERA
jgi:1-acyl-sn-glycerol-3-phosphate acyltransferase